MTARVGRVVVPLTGARHPTFALFASGAKGGRERGLFLFWTAVLKRAMYPYRRTVTVRARAVLPPGERFERMGREQRTDRSRIARRAYADLWARVLQRGAGIVKIRPATRREAALWLRTHPRDAEHLVALWVGPLTNRHASGPATVETTSAVMEQTA